MWRWISLLYQSLVQSVSLSLSQLTPPPPPAPPPPPSPQTTVIQARELNIIPPFDIVVLQSHSDASQLITLCTLKYTNVRQRSFVSQLLFNYNFTWTLPISGANRVSPSVHNYSGYNCSACLWNMLISQQGHFTQQRLCPSLWGLQMFKAADRTGSFRWTTGRRVCKFTRRKWCYVKFKCTSHKTLSHFKRFKCISRLSSLNETGSPQWDVLKAQEKLVSSVIV